LLVFAPVITGGGGTSGSGAGDNATCCEERAVELATCLGDGSLLVKSGCCSERCAALMRRVSARPAALPPRLQPAGRVGA
jgi:hypothetical protein